MSRKTFKGFSGKHWRLLSQILFFGIFTFLFIKTDYAGTDDLPYAVNIIFRIDPLVAACVLIAEKTFVFLLLPALATVILTLVFGRFFCGWVCPMGTLLDFTTSCTRFLTGSKPGKQTPETRSWKPYRKLKYFLLVFILVAAFFRLPLVGYLDPFSILVRGLTLAVYPGLNAAAASFFTVTYNHAPAVLNAMTEPVYTAMKATILPFDQKVFALTVFSFMILVAVFLLELLERRFFCKNLCPLGGMLALISRVGFLRGHGGSDACGKCRICETTCRMDAIGNDRFIAPEACNLCLDCTAECPRDIISFKFFSKPAGIQPATGLTRRAFLGTAMTGAVLPAVLNVRTSNRVPDPLLIRPPGALPEQAFLSRCVRCGECMKVCIGNALHPTFLEAGIDGMFTPRLIARAGYCEYNCTLCGQVCPTGAIKELGVEEKKKTVIGVAWFDKNHCLPYADGIPCIVCEEHCPTPDKAIKFRYAKVLTDQGEEITVKQPYVIETLCIGCGICETRCPIPGKSAVIVTSAGESRNPDHALPSPDDFMGSSPYS